MQEALAYCLHTEQRFLVIGKGSNCLFDDAGFEGVVLHNKLKAYEELKPGTFKVGAGYSIARLGAMTARQGWHGLEFAAGIPGSVGGAVYMNAGASGAQIADTLQEVTFAHPDGHIERLPRSSLEFSYRYSPFQSLPGIITGAVFALKPSSEAYERQRSLLSYRTKTQPYSDKSAGCIFRNPPEKSAGALIEACGLKGYTIGGAQISPKHANFIVNIGHATAADVLALMALIRTSIKKFCGIDLESEVRYIPYRDTSKEYTHG